MTIATKGIQPLDDTDQLSIVYKHTREPAWRAAGKDGTHATVADGSGNGYTLSSPADAHITNGPLGKDGWDNVAAPFTALQFARRFSSSLTSDVESDVIDSAVPIAANGEHTLQVCFRCNWEVSAANQGLHATANNTSGSGVGNDFINRIRIRTDGALDLFSENNDTNVLVVSSTGAVQPGKWQFATFVFRVANASDFDCRIFVHTLDAGVVSGIGGDSLGFDKEATSIRCAVTSGLTDGRIDYGAETLGANDYIGDIALGRFVKEAMSDEDVDAEAREFLTTGTIASWGSNELYRHEFNEEPDLVDEGPLGFHIWNQGSTFADIGGLDLVGSGGTVFSLANPTYVSRNYAVGMPLADVFSEASPVYIADLFSDALRSMPEWTIQFIASPLFAGTGVLGFGYVSQASGESLSSNHVVSVALDMQDGILDYFAERSSGTNIALGTTAGAGQFSAESQLAARLYTLRCGDDPGSPGTPLLRLSEDDDIDVHTAQTSGVPQGGNWNTGLNMPWNASSLVQEFAFFSRELTDEEIEATAANIGSGGGGGAPTVTIISPTEGGALTTAGQVIVDVTDGDGLAFVELTVTYPGGATEVVFRGADFRRPFTGTRAAITNGFRYTIERDGGWPTGNPRFEVAAVDSGGNAL